MQSISLPLLSYLSLKRLRWSLVALPASVVHVIFLPLIPPTEVCVGPASSRLQSLGSASYLSLGCRQVCSSLLCKTDLVSQLLEAVSTQALSPQVPPPHTPREGIQILHSVVQNGCDPHVFKSLFHCSEAYATFQM